MTLVAAPTIPVCTRYEMGISGPPSNGGLRSHLRNAGPDFPEGCPTLGPAAPTEGSIQYEELADIEAMLTQTPNLPPALQRIATTPVLGPGKPAGFPHVKVTRLAANRRIHTQGAVRIDFSNS